MVPRYTLFAVVGCVLLLWSVSGFGNEWTDTEVFVDAPEAAEAITEGAVAVDARERSVWESQRLPRAVSLHWTDFVDGSRSGSVIDDDAQLTAMLQNAGVSTETPVIVYGAWSGEGAWGEEGRIFWTLEYLGHSDVRILYGGIDEWKRAGYATYDGTYSPSDSDRRFHIDRNDELRVDYEQLRSAVDGEGNWSVVDTRDADEYDGRVKYGERRGGRIPGAAHLWWKDLFDADGSLRPPHQVQRKLDDRGLNGRSAIAAYCTGGIRSGFVYATLRALGVERVANYDASMWEWTSRSDAPLER